jgi:tetratricopeptide (TPR) repeat protein
MPLKNFFADQIDLLRRFMANPEQTVRCVLVEPDMRPLLLKILSRLDGEDGPHILLGSEVPFTSRRQFFEDLLREAAEQFARWEGPLRAAGLESLSEPKGLAALPPDERYVTYLGALAEGLPDHVGSVVTVLAPEQVADADGYRQAVEFLATRTPSLWAKFLILDERKQPALQKLGLVPRYGVQSFHLAPEQIESQARADLEIGTGLTPPERRQYTALLAGFAFARKEYDDTLRLQQTWLEMIGPEDDPAEVANAHYNLGNTHLARKDYAAAEASFGRALAVALEQNLDNLAAMVLTNLGVTLQRQGKVEQALRSFQIARDTCKARGLKPTEAHVLDCQARTYEQDNKPDEAERCWQEALAVYDGMTSETFAPAREGGRADILEKLQRVGEAKKRAKKGGWFPWAKGA